MLHSGSELRLDAGSLRLDRFQRLDDFEERGAVGRDDIDGVLLEEAGKLELANIASGEGAPCLPFVGQRRRVDRPMDEPTGSVVLGVVVDDRRDDRR